MSNTYQDLDLTNFPDSMDPIYLMEDPNSSSDMNAILAFMSAMENSDFAGARQILENNPRIQKMFFDAFKWNRHEEMIIAIERVWDGNVQSIIAQMAINVGAGPNGIYFPDGENLLEKSVVWDELPEQMVDLQSSVTAQLNEQNQQMEQQFTAQDARVNTAIAESDAKKQNKINGGKFTLAGGVAWVLNGSVYQQAVNVPGLPADAGGASTATCTEIGWAFDSMKDAGTYGVGLYDQPAGQLVFRALKQPPNALNGSWTFEEVTALA